MPQRLAIASVFAAALSGGSQADRAIQGAFRTAGFQAGKLTILVRSEVSPDLDVVAAQWSGGQPNSKPLGVFLQSRAQPSLIFQIGLEQGSAKNYCDLHAERATPTELVLSCATEQSGIGPNQIFRYSIGTKKLVSRAEFQPFSMRRILRSNAGVALVGSDTHRVIAVAYRPVIANPFQVLSGTASQNLVGAVSVSQGTVGMNQEFVSMDPKPFRAARFGPENRFRVTQEKDRILITEQQGGHIKRYRLPQSSYAQFAGARPETARGIQPRSETFIDEEIGPWQIADDTFWFAKTFSDGEGNTGVGAFGYFDTATRQFIMDRPKEIIDWSASALLVEPAAIWLALSSRGEYGDVSGGLLRFDRETHQITHFATRDLFNEMALIQGRVLLTSDFGMALVENGKLRRFFVEPDKAGRLAVVETTTEN